MRLPEFLTELSPVRETLEAIGQAEQVMAEAVAEKNKQVTVTQADSSLTLWERDYGLPVHEDGDPEVRRAAIRAAIAGGRTLTPALLRELCVTLGGADRGNVTEDFAHWRVLVEAVAEGRPPRDSLPLEQAVNKLKPAHLAMEVTSVGELSAGSERYAAPAGSLLSEVTGDDIQRAALFRHCGLTCGVLEEIREAAQ